MPIAAHPKRPETSVEHFSSPCAYPVVGTPLSEWEQGLSHTIARLDDAISYFRNIDNKHCRRFFDMIMALLIKRNSNERDYIGWSGVLLLLYASKQ